MAPHDLASQGTREDEPLRRNQSATLINDSRQRRARQRTNVTRQVNNSGQFPLNSFRASFDPYGNMISQLNSL